MRRDLVCEWPTESRRGQHKRVPRVKNPDTSEGSKEPAASSASGSSSKPPKAKKPKVPKAKLSPEEIERRKIATDVQAVTERRTALSRQRKLAAAQRKKMIELQMLAHPGPSDSKQ